MQTNHALNLANAIKRLEGLSLNSAARESGRKDTIFIESGKDSITYCDIEVMPLPKSAQFWTMTESGIKAVANPTIESVMVKVSLRVYTRKVNAFNGTVSYGIKRESAWIHPQSESAYTYDSKTESWNETQSADGQLGAFFLKGDKFLTRLSDKANPPNLTSDKDSLEKYPESPYAGYMRQLENKRKAKSS